VTISQEAFIRADARICPCCQSADVSEEDEAHGGIERYITMYCDNCDSSWDEVYALTGFRNVEEGEPEETEEDNTEINFDPGTQADQEAVDAALTARFNQLQAQVAGMDRDNGLPRGRRGW
jgi:hypothetical protein